MPSRHRDIKSAGPDDARLASLPHCGQAILAERIRPIKRCTRDSTKRLQRATELCPGRKAQFAKVAVNIA